MADGGASCDDTGMSPVLPGVVLPGAEPFEAEGGPVGVLLCHGFTGSPQSLRSWAEYLASQGLSVSLPRLPGHGTSWQDMARTGGQDWYTEVDVAFGALASRCEQVFVFGLSMGGCLALRLAEVHGSKVRGLVLVNPSLAPDTKLFLLARHSSTSCVRCPASRATSRSRASTSSATTGADPGSGYAAQAVGADDQPPRDVTQPVLVYRSTVDHVVGPASMRVLLAGLAGGQVTVRECPDSYHVATLDNDAQAIFEGSLKFVNDHAS